ncbi:uncharacterized protein LOC135147317 isoform X1 [Daucus carota subsp. sativus]|uniref:uncharacterized protein LOC135147317 isoform X1 n=1 Tax=Daucus carota subsp. sativus TaxID=79200 RepID=UPI003082E36D
MIESACMYVPVSPLSMKFHDQQLFFRRDIPPPHIRTQVVQPPEPAALPDLAREFQTPSP